MTDSTPKRRWFQFSLRTLLAGTSALALLLGLITWHGEVVSRTAEVFMAIGIGLIALGVCLRRSVVIRLGVVVLVILIWEIVFVTPNRTDQLTFRRHFFVVIDAQTRKPIEGATVSLRTLATSSGITSPEGRIVLNEWCPDDSGSNPSFREHDGPKTWRLDCRATGYVLSSMKSHYSYEPMCTETTNDSWIIPMNPVTK